jgi:hypothetical protein
MRRPMRRQKTLHERWASEEVPFRILRDVSEPDDEKKTEEDMKEENVKEELKSIYEN